MREPIIRHNWVKSTLGHGEMMCSKCLVTNREAAVLGTLHVCTVANAKPAPKRPEPLTSGISPASKALAALAYSMWDSEHTSKLSENPHEMERMFHTAQQTIVWLKVFGFEITRIKEPK